MRLMGHLRKRLLDSVRNITDPAMDRDERR
jgi:hypothetical protein